MKEKGKLTEIPVPRLVKALVEKNFSGELRVTDDSRIRLIMFNAGMIKNAVSNAEEDRIFHMLMRAGDIDENTFNKFRAQMQKASGAQEIKFLIQKGYLESGQVYKWIQKQIVKIIIQLYGWEAGEFQIKSDTETTAKTGIAVDIPFEKIHWLGIRNYCSDQVVDRLIPFSGTVFKPVVNVDQIGKLLKLSSQELEWLNKIDGEKTLKTLMVDSGIDIRTAKKLIYCLHSLGVLQLAGKSGLKTASGPGDGTAGSGKPADQTRPVSPDDSAMRTKILQFQRIASEQNPYQILGVPQTADFDRIRQAYRRQAKEYHPDRFRMVKDKDLATVAQENFLKISEAFQLLSDPAERKRVDNSLHDKTKRPTPSEAMNAAKQAAEQCFKDGMTEMQKGNTARAQAHFQAATVKDAYNPKFKIALADVLSRDPKNIADARTAVMKAIELEPENAEYQAVLGDVYHRAGLKTQAKIAYQKALQMDPSLKHAQEALQNIEKPASGTRKKSIFGKFFNT